MAVFSENRPYRFQFDLTDKCNAACPMCARTLPMDFCRTDLTKVDFVELNFEDFEANFPQKLCDRTEQVSFGGTLGEPTIVRSFPRIIDFLTGRGVTVSFSTNGSTNDPAWWRRVGEMMHRTGSWVELHIDGLADTNQIYRIHTEFDRIIENAEAYLATGAEAEWRFVIFRHNQHQIPEAFKLSREMGFARFVLIDTSRFWYGSRFPYVSPEGEHRYLEEPTMLASQFRLADDEIVNIGGEASPHESANVECATAALNRPYISAHGQVSTCGWVSGSDEEASFFARHGLGLDDFNIRHRPLWDIIRGEPFETLYDEANDAGELGICKRKCQQKIRSWRYAF